jgi:glutaredoxin
MPKPSQISIVLAQWCPHCVPLSLEMTKKMSEDLGIPYRVLDIDDEENSKIGDDLVERYGDSSDDYLIPQVFLEYPNGKIQHIFTGFSENTAVTKKHWEDLFSSGFYKQLSSS